jgi:hypothetical protein
MQEFVLHGKFTDAPHGCVEIVLKWLTRSLAKGFVDARQSPFTPTLEPIDLHPQFSR